MGYRMAPGGKFSCEYVVVDVADFKGISLNMKTRHTKFQIYEHYVQKIALGQLENGSHYKFPLRAKYERANVDIDAIERPQEAAADQILVPNEPPPGADPNDMGTSVLGPLHRGMYRRDRRGQKYLVDQWGIKVTLNRRPDVLYRPEGITQEAWRTADAGLRRTWVDTFPPRVQGIEPEGETAKVVRRRELEGRRSKQREKRAQRTSTAMAGIGSLLGKTALTTERHLSDSSDGDEISIADDEADHCPPSASARLAKNLKVKTRSVQRKELELKTKGCSAAPSGLWFDALPGAPATESQCETDTGPSGSDGDSDDDWTNCLPTIPLRCGGLREFDGNGSKV